MIVFSGELLLVNAQLSYLATLQWGLFTNDFATDEKTLFAQLTEAAWGGYARVTSGPWTVPRLIGNRAFTSPVTAPSFTNTSGLGETWFGWFLVDPAGSVLVACNNIGQQILPDGGVYSLSAGVSDVEEELVS